MARETPRSRAARAWTPSSFWRASITILRSCSRRASEMDCPSRISAESDGPSSCSCTGLGTSKRSMSFALDKMTARSIVCSSSRTFPGQECWRSAAIAEGLADTPCFRCFSANFCRKCSARRGMSSARSAREGRQTSKTLRR